MDVVIAATGEDTANVLACAFAAAESVEAFTVAVLHRLALLPLVRQFGIDAALSPRTASANAVLRQMRGGAASVATFLECDVEVDEFVIRAGSPADGAVVQDLHLPRSVLLGAVVRPDGTQRDRAGSRPDSAPARASCCSPGRQRSTTFGGCSPRERSADAIARAISASAGRRTTESLLCHVLGLTLSVTGAGIAASGIVGWMHGGPDVVTLVVFGVIVVGRRSSCCGRAPRCRGRSGSSTCS